MKKQFLTISLLLAFMLIGCEKNEPKTYQPYQEPTTETTVLKPEPIITNPVMTHYDSLRKKLIPYLEEDSIQYNLHSLFCTTIHKELNCGGYEGRQKFWVTQQNESIEKETTIFDRHWNLLDTVAIRKGRCWCHKGLPETYDKYRHWFHYGILLPCQE